MSLSPNQQLKVSEVLRSVPEVKVCYLFGSRARNEANARSDYDIAIYADCEDKKRLAEIHLHLAGALLSAIGSDDVDVLVLNGSRNTLLNYNVISEGEVLHEDEGFRIPLEIKIMNEYFDFRLFEQQHFDSKTNS